MSESAVEVVVEKGLWRWVPLAWLRARLRGRPDSEHELTINRLALSGLVFGYLIVAGMAGSAQAADMLRTDGIFFALYYALSVGFFCHILYQPKVSAARRILGVFFDLGMFSYGMHLGDEAMAPFFPIYLWVILGNGFRFGIPYLFVASVVGVVGFGLVMLTTDVWLAHRNLGIGLLASLVFLPLYVSTLIRKLSAAKRQAEEASRAKSLFLASVSHELRTPLNAVIGLSDLLMGSRLDAEQEEMTRTIGQSGRSLLALINSILDFARIEAGHMPKNSVDFDLYGLIFEIRKMLAVQADAKNITLAVHIAPRVPRSLRGPRSHLGEIVMNLAANAVKFTERGYVVIAVDTVGEAGARARLRFEVTDTGIGIEPKAQTRIFDSFAQADETIIDRFGGTGLGLALVKQLVELHGGALGVDSTPGVGSTFWCELDFETSAENGSAPAPCGVSVVLQSRDDALRRLLEDSGADVNTAETSAAAAAIAARLREQRRHPVIIVDTPSVEAGLQASASLCGAAPVPAVLVTDQPVAGMLESSARSRFVAALARPLDPAALLAALEIAGGCDLRDGPDDGREIIVRSKRKLTVLVAEDNRTNQKVIAKILERAGHVARIVENGEEAMDALAEQAFDIVLMDVNMPVMNGLETTKLYRFASVGQPRIPILALTADATAEMEARCRDAGMDGCLTKPIEPARLVATIENVVAERTAGDGTNPAPAEDVVEISDHPKFSTAAACVLNTQVLDDLRGLGGNAFLNELAVQFVADATSLLRDLEKAVARADAQSFREHVHALRSGAANIGAQGVYQMCLSWRRIGARELDSRGEGFIAKLAAELERVRTALDGYLAELNAAEPTAQQPLKVAAAQP